MSRPLPDPLPAWGRFTPRQRQAADAAWSRILSDPRGGRSREPALLSAMQALCLLWFGEWDDAHVLVQEHEGRRECDWVHAVIHRVEGDAGNSRYWWRSAGLFPAGPAVAREAQALGLTGEEPWEQEALRGRWDPVSFTDWSLRQPLTSAKKERARLWQAAEWRGLLDYWLSLGEQ